MTGPRRRVLLIGFDCADSDLVSAWSKGGYMPACEALRRDGVWWPLGTTSSAMHVSAWPTLYTGTSPGVHGVSHAYHVPAGEQRIRFADPMSYGQPPFWRYLDDAGLKCIVFDPFACYRLENFKGVQVNEYGTWTWFGDPGSTPSNLLKEIKRRFGPYPAPEHSKLVHLPADLVGYRDQLVAGAKLKGRITRTLLREHDWDLAFVSFGEAHAAGHYLWHTQDEAFPLQPGKGRAPGNLLRDVYSGIDEAIGEIVEDVGDDVTVIVMSVDGMGPNYSGTHFMPEVLHKLGLFYSSTVGRDGAGANPQNTSSGPSLLRRVRDSVPLPMRQAVNRCLPRRLQYRRQLMWLNSGIEWSKTRVFSIPSSDEALFRINLSGREPLGNVAPGAEYDALVETLQQELGLLTNPLNGEVAAANVIPVGAVFPGPKQAELPDVVTKWNTNARIGSDLESPSFGHLHLCRAHEVPPFYTGNHRSAAFAIMRAPSLPRSMGAHEAHIIDIAPTLLNLLGVEPPPHFEGRVWA